MSRRALFGLVALLPAALNVSTARAAGGSVELAICTGDGASHRALSIPLGRGDGLPGNGDGGGCCAKACHAGGRKRTACM